MSPKRSVFSLNIDSNTEHYHQRISEPDHPDGNKVVEINGPTHGHTDLSYISKPFEKVVNRAVDEVVKDTGKKVRSVEGDIRYTSQSSKNTSSSSSTYTGNLNIKNKSTRRFIERKYDTSDL
jgi:hypothetical protein